jgi:hypothetical protein
MTALGPSIPGRYYVARIFRESPRAYLLGIGSRRFWVPRSQIIIVEPYRHSKFEKVVWIPNWLAARGRFIGMAVQEEVA